MRKLILLSTLLAIICTTYSINISGLDESSYTQPEYCLDGYAQDLNNDYTVCEWYSVQQTSNDSASTDTINTDIPIETENDTSLLPSEYCADDFTGPLTPEQIAQCEALENGEINSLGYFPSYCLIPDYLRFGNDGNDYTVCVIPPVAGDKVYEGEYVTSEGTYQRIEYNSVTGEWHGVAVIENIGIYYDRVLGNYTRFDVKFSRELSNLESIKLSYTTERTCTIIFGTCIPFTKKESETVTKEYANKTEDDLWWQGMDNIYYYGSVPLIGERPTGLEYDYSIKIYKESRPISKVEFLEYKYKLTPAEAEQLNLDIHDQYWFELAQIYYQEEISIYQKQLMITDLNIYYSKIPNVTEDTLIKEICYEDDVNCIEINEDVPIIPDNVWNGSFDDLWNIVLKVISTILLIVIGIITVLLFGREMMSFITSLIFEIGLAVAGLIKLIFIDPFIEGLKIIASIFLSGITPRK